MGPQSGPWGSRVQNVAGLLQQRSTSGPEGPEESGWLPLLHFL